MDLRASLPRGRAWQMHRNLLRPFVVRFWRREVAALGDDTWDAHRVQRRGQRTRTGNEQDAALRMAAIMGERKPAHRAALPNASSNEGHVSNPLTVKVSRGFS